MPGRLGRTPFVGREQELARLRGAYDDAAAGQGSLVMVVGEPGIGKTALCSELLAHVVAQGGCALSGHCYEQGSLSLPYQPFLEALGTYVLTREPAELLRELGFHAVELARILPELRMWDAPAPEAGPTADPQEARYRLFQSVRALVHIAAAAQPVCLLLEDLHDADGGTLDLLLHLGRQIAGERLLLVGTYRDVEVDRAHPLSGALAELRRATAFDRLHLRGLAADEVQQILESVAIQPISPDLAQAVHDQTEGNPLFAQEVSRYLAEEGRLGGGERAGLQPARPDGPLGLAVPEGLRDVIGKRLSRLSPACNQVLGVAAVIGREFGLDTLQSLGGAPEEQLVVELQEAGRAGLIEEAVQPGGVRYRFVHALHRQTLYEELNAPRRLRLHQQVARALEERYAGRLSEHASELAEHFSQSTEAADLAKAVGYAELAAQQANTVYAYGEAARHLERALQWQAVLDPNDKARRCDLLLALGEALVYTGEPTSRAEVAAEEAYTLADAIADHPRAVRAYYLAVIILGPTGTGTLQTSNWITRIEMHAEPETLGRLLADIRLATVAMQEERWSDWWAYRERALDLARRLPDPEAIFIAMYPFVSSPITPANAAAQYRVAQEFEAKGAAGVSTRRAGMALWFCRLSYFQHGERERWEQLGRRVQELGERTQYSLFRVFTIIDDLAIAGLDGDLEGVVEAGANLIVRSEELGSPAFGRLVAPWYLSLARRYLGRYDEALSGLDAGGAAFERATRAAILAEIGRAEEARAGVQQFLQRAHRGDELQYVPLAASVHFLEAAIELGEREAASTLLQALSSAAPLFAATCIARHLGAAAALLGEHEQALRYYEQALDLAGRLRHRPELALTHLGMAELLLDAGNGSRVSGYGDGTGAGAIHRAPTDGTGSGPDSVGARHASPSGPGARTEAMRHLDIAIPELREMKMQPSLERALKLLDRASASVAAALHTPVYPDGLSPREVEVLRLIAAGKSNQAIADELVISVNTVMRHITNLFVKVGAANRTEAASYAHRQGLA